MSETVCRFCGAPVEAVFADLGMSPLANSYLPPERANRMEPFYPLRALVCERVLPRAARGVRDARAIFSDYAYFSSYSSSWLEHCRRYTEQMIERLGLGDDSHVVELASNDGYLLQYFHERQIPVLGIEPAANVAKVALQKGIPTLVEFFGRETARSLAGESAADLLLGNNVLAHVPDLNDFVAGMKILLKPGGVITMEFPHLMRLIDENQWDTIYHEHFSYFSFLTVSRVFEAHGLRLFDVEELPTHGGSLRIYGCHADDAQKPDTDAARELREREREAGYEQLETYLGYGRRVGRQAPDPEVPDRAEGGGQTRGRLRGAGQGQHAAQLLRGAAGLPRLHLRPQPAQAGALPARQPHPDPLAGGSREDRPDVVLILPWNLKDEIIEQLSFIREWGGRFAARTPELTLLP